MSCSVCGDGRQSMGGFLLWERNGKISAICNDCWFSFTNASPNSRVARTDAQKAALMVEICKIDRMMIMNLGEDRRRASIVLQSTAVYEDFSRKLERSDYEITNEKQITRESVAKECTV